MFWMRSKTPKRSTSLYHVAASISLANSSIGKQINNVKKLIFDFDYNYQNEDFKDFFEKSFIEKYYTYNFADETFELFQIHLAQKTREVFKNYEKLLNYYFNQSKNDFLDETKRTFKEKSSDKNKNINATLPVGIVNSNDIGAVDYGDGGSLSEFEKEHESTETVTNSSNLFEKEIKNMTAFQDFFSKMLDEFQSLFSILI